jgi:hypothetical protein
VDGWQILHRWYMPFIVFAIGAAFSVPWALYFEAHLQPVPAEELGLAYGQAWMPRDSVLAAMTPYLFTLAPFIWLFDGEGRTRWAAFWATLVGIIRIAVPVALVTMTDVQVLDSGQRYVDWATLRIMVWFAEAEVIALGMLLWASFATLARASRKARPAAAMAYEAA